MYLYYLRLTNNTRAAQAENPNFLRVFFSRQAVFLFSFLTFLSLTYTISTVI